MPTVSDAPSGLGASAAASTVTAATIPLSFKEAWRLPIELLATIRDTLEAEGQYASLTALACCSRSTSALVSPCLPDPRRFVINELNVDEIFRDVLGYRPADATRSAPSESTVLSGTRKPTTNARVRHVRLVERLEECRHLTITSRAALEKFLEASELIGTVHNPIGTLGPAIYKPVWDVHHLRLSPELLWDLSERSRRDTEMCDQLCQLVRARHLCVSMHIGEPEAKHGTRERPGIQPLWERRCRVRVPEVVQRIVELMAPVRVTVHDMTVQKIPAVYSARTRFFFRQLNGDEQQGVRGLRPKTKATICDELGDGLLGLSDGNVAETFEVIGLDDGRKSTRDKADETDPRVRTPVNGTDWMKAEDMTLHRIGQRWVRDLLERTVVYKLTREAASCETCGEK